jgi:hypothetical protein
VVGAERGLANLPTHTATDLVTAVKNRLKQMRCRPGLIDGYLAGTSLSTNTRQTLTPKRCLERDGGPRYLVRS